MCIISNNLIPFHIIMIIIMMIDDGHDHDDHDHQLGSVDGFSS